MDTEKKIPLCVHCKFYEDEYLKVCTHGAKRVTSPVDGTPAWDRSLPTCANARDDRYGACKRAGLLFEAEPERVI